MIDDVLGRLALGGKEDIDMVPGQFQAARNPVSICGWLYKMKRRQRAFLPAWVQRWFAVENGRLCWYGSKGEARPRGAISLSSVSSVKEFEGSQPAGGEGVYSFVVRSSERNLLLRAQNERDLLRWVSNLRLQIEYQGGGPLDGVVPGAHRKSLDRKDAKAKKKDDFDVVLGKIEAALQELEVLEEVVSLAPPEPTPRKGEADEIVIQEEEEEGCNRSTASSSRDSLSASSASTDMVDDMQQHSAIHEDRRRPHRHHHHDHPPTRSDRAGSREKRRSNDREQGEVEGPWRPSQEVREDGRLFAKRGSPTEGEAERDPVAAWGQVKGASNGRVVMVRGSRPMPTSGRPRPQLPARRESIKRLEEEQQRQQQSVAVARPVPGGRDFDRLEDIAVNQDDDRT